MRGFGVAALAFAVILAGSAVWATGSAKAGEEPASASEFARALQSALKSGNARWIAEHARYPLKVAGPSGFTVANAKTFLVLQRSILAPDLVTAILAANPETATGSSIAVGATARIRAESESGAQPGWRIVAIEQ